MFAGGDSNKKESETKAETDTGQRRAAHQKCFCVHHRGGCLPRNSTQNQLLFYENSKKNRHDQNTSYWVCCKSRILYRHTTTNKVANGEKRTTTKCLNRRKRHREKTDRRRDSVRRCHVSRHHFSTGVLPVHDYYILYSAVTRLFSFFFLVFFSHYTLFTRLTSEYTSASLPLGTPSSSYSSSSSSSCKQRAHTRNAPHVSRGSSIGYYAALSVGRSHTTVFTPSVLVKRPNKTKTRTV